MTDTNINTSNKSEIAIKNSKNDIKTKLIKKDTNGQNNGLPSGHIPQKSVHKGPIILKDLKELSYDIQLKNDPKKLVIEKKQIKTLKESDILTEFPAGPMRDLALEKLRSPSLDTKATIDRSFNVEQTASDLSEALLNQMKADNEVHVCKCCQNRKKQEEEHNHNNDKDKDENEEEDETIDIDKLDDKEYKEILSKNMNKVPNNTPLNPVLRNNNSSSENIFNNGKYKINLKDIVEKMNKLSNDGSNKENDDTEDEILFMSDIDEDEEDDENDKEVVRIVNEQVTQKS